MVSANDTPVPSTAAYVGDDNRDLSGTASPGGASTGSAAQGSAAASPGNGRQAGDDLFERVVQGAHQTIDRLAEGAAPHVHKLQDSVASASEQLHHRADQAREMGDQWAESLRCTVRDNPLTAVAAAVAVGLLLARLSQR